MSVSEAQKKASIKYARENLKRIPLDVPKEKYEEIKHAATTAGEPVNGYIKKAIDERIQRNNGHTMDMTDRAFGATLTEEENILLNIVYENESLFDDMLFASGTASHDLIACKSSCDKGVTWIDDEAPLPEALEFFSYSFFSFKIASLEDGFLGCFEPETQTITISPDEYKNESAILHEMIHLHEFVLDTLQSFYHDAILWCLYNDLKNRIPDLNDHIEAHGHILNEQNIYNLGGTHDILFLLKSFDLDIKKGYNLGTVFGYGYDSSCNA